MEGLPMEDELNDLHRQRVRRELRLYLLRENITPWTMAKRMEDVLRSSDKISHRIIERYISGARSQIATTKAIQEFLIKDTARVYSINSNVRNEIFAPDFKLVKAAVDYMDVMGTRHQSRQDIADIPGCYKIVSDNISMEVLVDGVPGTNILLARAVMRVESALSRCGFYYVFDGFVVPAIRHLQFHMRGIDSNAHFVIHMPREELDSEHHWLTAPHPMSPSVVESSHELSLISYSIWKFAAKALLDGGRDRNQIVSTKSPNANAIEFRMGRRGKMDGDYRDLFVTGHNLHYYRKLIPDGKILVYVTVSRIDAMIEMHFEKEE